MLLRLGLSKLQVSLIKIYKIHIVDKYILNSKQNYIILMCKSVVVDQVEPEIILRSLLFLL